MTGENKSLSATQKIADGLSHLDSQDHKPPKFTRPISATVMSSTALESMVAANESLVKAADAYITALESDIESGARKIDERTAGLTSLNIQSRKQLADAEKKQHRKTVLVNSDQRRRETMSTLAEAVAAVETQIGHTANARALLNRMTILDPGMSPIQAQVAAAGPAAISDFVNMAVSLLRDANSLESEKQRARCLIAACAAKLDQDRDLMKALGWNSATIADEAVGGIFRSLRLRLELLRVRLKRQQFRELGLVSGSKKVVELTQLAFMEEKELPRKYGTAA